MHMDAVSSIIHKPVSSVSPIDSPTRRPVLNHSIRTNNPLQPIQQVRQSPSFDNSLSSTMRQPFQNIPLASEHTNGISAYGFHGSASGSPNGSPKQRIQSCAQSPTHTPTTNGSKVTAEKRPSAIPRFRPSAIPRLNTHQTLLSSTEPQLNKSIPVDAGLVRSRVMSRPLISSCAVRSTSEHPQRFGDNESDTSSVFSSSGAPRKITSKINSLKNVQHKPGGGNVTIVDEKLNLGHISSKCNSMANVKHKPGGGHVQIVDVKIDTSSVQPKVNSLKNVNHTPAGGQVQIVSEKLEFDKKAKSKVGSFANARYHPGGGDVKIYNESLPWLKYNRPNLSPDEKARINKHLSLTRGDMTSSVHSVASSALTSNSGTGV